MCKSTPLYFLIIAYFLCYPERSGPSVTDRREVKCSKYSSRHPERSGEILQWLVAQTKSHREAELYFCEVAKIKRFRYNIAETGSPLKVRYLCA